MIDRTIPYVPLIMRKSDPENFPVFPLPQGYSFDTWHPGLEEAWCQIQCSADHIENEEKAREIFKKEFLGRPEDAAKRCFYIFAPDGSPAGAGALWVGDLFGEPLCHVHWIAVAEEHQGKGLAKALITRLMQCYHELAQTGDIYLESQTWSYAALSIYDKFGFRPYLGPRPENCDDEDFEAEQQRGWEIVRQKISLSE